MAEIIPAILTDSSAKFKEIVRKVEPYTKRIHVDIADGEFVPNKTVSGYEELKDIEAGVKFDIHLMVRKPEDHLKEWLHTHADRFILHIESEGDPSKLIEDLHANNRKVGLALNPETEISKVEPLLNKIDFIQFMTVKPGFQGSLFATEVVDKIADFHSRYPDIIIMSDGGITPETAPMLSRAGVSELVSGSYIIKSPDIKTAIGKLQESCTTL